MAKCKQKSLQDKSLKLNKIVSFRIPDAVFEEYQVKIASSGKNPAEYFRDCVLKNETQIVVDGKLLSMEEMKERARIIEMSKAQKEVMEDIQRQKLFVFNKCGNNLNQITCRLHTDHLKGTLSEDVYIHFLQELVTIQSYMKGAL